MSTSPTVVRMVRQPPAFTVGDRIRMVRRELRMTQFKFAAFLEITKPLLAAYESGIRPVPTDHEWTLGHRIEKLTGFPAAWLVTGVTGDPEDNTPTSAQPPTEANHRTTAYKSHGSRRGTLRIAA